MSNNSKHNASTYPESKYVNDMKLNSQTVKPIVLAASLIGLIAIRFLLVSKKKRKIRMQLDTVDWND